jgi:hypothetical protein
MSAVLKPTERKACGHRHYYHFCCFGAMHQFASIVETLTDAKD